MDIIIKKLSFIIGYNINTMHEKKEMEKLTATLPNKWPHCHCHTESIASLPESTAST